MSSLNKSLTSLRVCGHPVSKQFTGKGSARSALFMTWKEGTSEIKEGNTKDFKGI